MEGEIRPREAKRLIKVTQRVGSRVEIRNLGFLYPTHSAVMSGWLSSVGFSLGRKTTPSLVWLCPWAQCE